MSNVIESYHPMPVQSSAHNTCVKHWRLMVLLPALILVLAVILEYSGIDVWWASLFYDPETQTWPYKHHWFFETGIHTGGQLLDKLFALLWLIAFFTTYINKSFSRYKKILLYFVCASATGPIMIGICKNMTHIYTPWKLQLFNGKQPYIRLLDTVPLDAPIGHGFPAAHAAGGYCLLSLYFVFCHYRSPYKNYGLLAGLGLGLIFGLGQQIRGAHFPSHDLFTLVICWYSSLFFYYVFYRKEFHPQPQETM